MTAAQKKAQAILAKKKKETAAKKAAKEEAKKKVEAAEKRKAKAAEKKASSQPGVSLQENNLLQSFMTQTTTIIKALHSMDKAIAKLNKSMAIVATGFSDLPIESDETGEEDKLPPEESGESEDPEQLTEDQIKEVTREALDRAGSPAVTALFEQFGIARISELPKEQYAEMQAELEAL